jgi:hypothetical protein
MRVTILTFDATPRATARGGPHRARPVSLMLKLVSTYETREKKTYAESKIEHHSMSVEVIIVITVIRRKAGLWQTP